VAAIANHAGGEFPVKKIPGTPRRKRASNDAKPVRTESKEREVMAKKKKARKKAKKKPGKARASSKGSRLKARKSKSAATRKQRGSRRNEVASITSGNEASTLDPRGQLIVETEEEASPGVHPGDLSGDLQGLSTTELFDSESVSELSEEGQDLEAELIEGIEDAPDPDQGEVKVHKAPRKRVPDYGDRSRI
jgi:hypothetical protein